jgi:glutamate-ammonia-ligase adenylyltransferase
VRYPSGGLDRPRREIRRIKARVDAERLPRGADRATHTKLGTGGLADVEWTVQLLQLQHAGDVPELRTTSTLDGLRECVEAGLLAGADADALAPAGRWPPGPATRSRWSGASPPTSCRVRAGAGGGGQGDGLPGRR